MIEWKDSYSTGVTILDEQHKKLFEYTNDLEGVIQDGEVSESLIIGVLEYLEHYAKLHFGEEEECMFRHQCPIASQNQDAHKKFIDLYKSYEDKIKKEGAMYNTMKELHNLLEKWLVDHICRIDTQLKDCIH